MYVIILTLKQSMRGDDMDKLQILVVDDESRMRKLVRDFLEREGFEVLEAADGVDDALSNRPVV